MASVFFCIYFLQLFKRLNFFFFGVESIGIWKEKLGMTCINPVIKERL